MFLSAEIQKSKHNKFPINADQNSLTSKRKKVNDALSHVTEDIIDYFRNIPQFAFY